MDAPEPTIEDTKKFAEELLTAAPTANLVPGGKTVSLPELKPTDLAAEAPTEEKQPEPIPPPATFVANSDNQGNTAEKFLASTEYEFTPEEVRPSDADRELFLESVLDAEDNAVTLTVELPGLRGKPFVFRARTQKNELVLFAMIEADTKAGQIKTPIDMLTWIQYYAVAFQLVSFNGKNYTTPTLPEDPSAAHLLLKKYVQENLITMSVPKWRLVLAAGRLFDARITLLSNELIRRKDFSAPAG